jgi:hypothetical protein
VGNCQTNIPAEGVNLWLSCTGASKIRNLFWHTLTCLYDIYSKFLNLWTTCPYRLGDSLCINNNLFYCPVLNQLVKWADYDLIVMSSRHYLGICFTKRAFHDSEASLLLGHVGLGLQVGKKIDIFKSPKNTI